MFYGTFSVVANIEYAFLRKVGFQQCLRNGDVLEFGKYTAQKCSGRVVASCGSFGINSKERFLNSRRCQARI